MNPNERILNISWASIFKILAAILLVYALFLTQEILIWFVFALIISILFSPAVDFFEKFKIPRILAIIFIYVAVFGLFSLFVYFVAPFFISELSSFSKILPDYLDTLFPLLKGLGITSFKSAEGFINNVNVSLIKNSSTILNILAAIFGGIVSTVFILTVAIFISLEKDMIEKTLALFSPKRYELSSLAILQRVKKRVIGWFWTRIIACFFVGVLAYFIFLLFHVNYPFSLALIAGALNFIPYVGPSLTGFLLFVSVFLDAGATKALFALVSFLLVQQTENNIITPILSKKIIGLSPALVLISLAVGGKLWGFWGAVLAVPLFGIIVEFLKDYLRKIREEEGAAKSIENF